VLISACLLGERVRYHGGDATLGSPVLERWVEEQRVVPFCPEVAGGLSVPRPPAEIRGEGGGGAVLDLRARVTTREGDDVTAEFLAGARGAVELARELDVALAVLVDRSPSCGSREVYDGDFVGRRIPGQGVTAALLERSGIRVFSEDELDEASAYLEAVEAP
jgi:uncharacterized protein YbbK (DUF523 family)